MANYCGSQFHYNATAKVISADASELFNFYGQAAFGIKSHRTDRIVFFMHLKTHRDVENEITHWEYIPMGKDPETQGWVVYVYND